MTKRKKRNMLKAGMSLLVFGFMSVSGMNVSYASTSPTMTDTTFSVNPMVAGDTFTVKAHINSPNGGNMAELVFTGSKRDIIMVDVYRNDSTGYWEGSYQTSEYEQPEKFTLTSVTVGTDAGTASKVIDEDSITPSFFVESNQNPPSKPMVDELTYLNTKLTGSSDPDSVVTVYAGSDQLGSATTDVTGHYSVPIQPQKGGTSLRVSAANKNGLTSEISVVVESAPPAPNVQQDVSDISDTVTGTSIPGLTISVQSGGTEIGLGTVEADGSYSVKIPVQKANTYLYVYAMDGTNKSQGTIVDVQDKTPPAPPTLDPVTYKSTTVSGMAEPLSHITIWDDSTTVNTSADVNGHFSASMILQNPGGFLYATDTDSAGNVSKPQKTLEIDTDAPSLFSYVGITDQSTSVRVDAEQNASISVKAGSDEIGNTSTPDGTSKIYNGTTNIPTTYKSYTVSFPKQPVGTVLSITATDADGQVSAPLLETVTDGTPPAAPTVHDVYNDSGAVTGTAEPDSSITVTEYYTDSYGRTSAGLSYKGKTGDDGTFSVSTETEIKPGTKLTVMATDAAGNKSDLTSVTVQDSLPPVPSVDPVTDQSRAVTGTTESYDMVYVQVPTSESSWQQYSARADYYGHYSVSIPAQKEGAELYLFAADKYNGFSGTKFFVVLDGTAPKAPVVNKVTTVSKHVNGTAEPGSSILVENGTVVVGKGATDEKGNFTVSIPAQNTGTKLSVTATDSAGNISKPTVVSLMTISAPSVNPIYDNSTSVSGTSAPNMTVVITAGTSILGTVTSYASGSFTLKIKTPKAGTLINAYVKDLDGNGPTKTVRVIDKTPPFIPVVHSVADNSTSITGSSESGATVYAVVQNKIVGHATAKNGVFTILITKQKAGTVMSVYAVDTAGNKSGTKTVTVADKTPPSVPSVNKVTYRTVYVTGKGEKFATVYVYNGRTKIGQAVVNSKLNFSVKIKTQRRGSTLTIYAQDKAGNKSPHKNVKVY